MKEQKRYLKRTGKGCLASGIEKPLQNFIFLQRIYGVQFCKLCGEFVRI